MVFVVNFSPTMEPHLLHSVPGLSQALVCSWNTALLVQADGASLWRPVGPLRDFLGHSMDVP